VGVLDKYAIPISGTNHVISPHKHPKAAYWQGMAAFCIAQSIIEGSKKMVVYIRDFPAKN
jgi:hypothetical protein